MKPKSSKSNMKELDMEMNRLRQLVLALMGREEVDCACGPVGGTVGEKVGRGNERDARESFLGLGEG